MTTLQQSHDASIASASLASEEMISWLQLYRANNVGPLTFQKLLERYHTVDQALSALPQLAQKTKTHINIPSRDQVTQEYETLLDAGGRWISWKCPEYAPLLRQIPDAPPIISVWGALNLTEKPILAIVGARNGSLAGCRFAHDLAKALGEAGFIIASGFARGIDTAAHKGTLNTGTIGVLAGGVNVIYPPENKDFFHDMRAVGTFVSESPWNTQPQARLFPKRNRILSGLCQGMIVIEAAERSGSLITARLGAEHGRDVFAVPGSPLDPRCAGTNSLLKDGATLITSPEDVLQNLSPLRQIYPKNAPNPLLTDACVQEDVNEDLQNESKSSHDMYETVLRALSFTPISPDALGQHCHFSARQLQSCLLELEIGGRIERLVDGTFCLKDKED